MTHRIIFYSASLFVLLAISKNLSAQDLHFTQFEASPLTINPAFAGNFSGQARVAAIYRDQWQSVTIPFTTYAASVDAPLVRNPLATGYFAGGLQVYRDKAGDGGLTNFSTLGSLAYHKFLGTGKDGEPYKTLSVGFQAGYTQQSVDISKLYFDDQYQSGSFSGASTESLNNKINYFALNAGIAWAHAPTDNFSYSLGIGANNLNQPGNALAKEQHDHVGLGIRYTAQAGAIWNTSERFSLRPAVLYQLQTTAYELIAGNEFSYIIGNPEAEPSATRIFAGGWYRNGDAAMASAGMEIKGLRIGLSYDYNVSALKTASNGNGGFEVSLRYIIHTPPRMPHSHAYSCPRF